MQTVLPTTPVGQPLGLSQLCWPCTDQVAGPQLVTTTPYCALYTFYLLYLAKRFYGLLINFCNLIFTIRNIYKLLMIVH